MTKPYMDYEDRLKEASEYLNESLESGTPCRQLVTLHGKTTSPLSHS